MATYFRNTSFLIILLTILASCSPAGTTASPASTRTATAPVIATGTRTPTHVTKTPTDVVITPTEVVKTATVTPSSVPGPLVATLGDPVPLGRGGIRGAKFSPDRKTIAIGWTNGVSLTGVDDQDDLWFWKAPEMVTAVDASSAYIAVLLVNGDVWLLDAKTGTGQRFPEVARVPGGDAFWGDVAWSPDGRLAAIQAVGGADTGATPILLLDPAAGEVTELPGSLINPGWKPYLVWSPDSRMIASANQERRGWVLDVTSGEVVFKAQPDDYGRPPRIYGWMPDSTVVIYGSDGGNSLRLVNILSRERVRVLTGLEIGFVPTPPVIISPKGALALVGGYSLGDYEIHPYQVWDLKLGRPLEVPSIGDTRHINSAGYMELDRHAVAFDGEEVIYLDTDGRLVRWKVGEQQGNTLGQIPVRYPSLDTPMIWSGDSTRLLLEMDRGKAVTVWDVAEGKLINERKDGTYPADLHGDILAYQGEDGNLVLWNIQENVEIDRLPGPVTSFKSGVRFSPDGKQIAYGVGKRLYIADVVTLETVAVLDAYPEGQEISHIDWAPSGDALVVASGSIRGFQDSPGILILWEKMGDIFVEAFRTENVQASADHPWAKSSLFNPTSRLVALERMPEPVNGQEAVLVYDRESRKVILEKQGYWMQQWLSEETLLLTKNCNFFEVNVRTGNEHQGLGEACQAYLSAFAPDGIHFSDILFSGRSVDIMNWRTGIVETARLVGSDLQDGVFSPDGRWLLVRALEGLVRAFPISYTQAEND